MNGIAVGFRPGNGLPPMAINCGAPAFKVSPNYLLNDVRPRLIELVRRDRGRARAGAFLSCAKVALFADGDARARLRAVFLRGLHASLALLSASSNAQLLIERSLT